MSTRRRSQNQNTIPRVEKAFWSKSLCSEFDSKEHADAIFFGLSEI